VLDGRCGDIVNAVSAPLVRFEARTNPYPGVSDANVGRQRGLNEGSPHTASV
jgi:hypothetical protein